ncbi:MAG: AraC family transcriptional regulator, partial [Starkeya sp.]|nr:AraC family transcriptional regulator [Starkeya sp.]
MTSTVEGITLLDELHWRSWNGIIADVWHVACAAGAGGHYVSRDARLFVVLEREGGRSDVQLSVDGRPRRVQR